MESALLAGVLGAVAGAVGFGLAFALRAPIVRLWAHPFWQRHGHLLVGVVFFVVALTVLRSVFLPDSDQAAEEKTMAELRSVPLVVAIIDADPTAEAEIRAIVREGLKSGDQTAVALRFAEFTRARVPRYFRTASDASVIGFTQVIVPLYKAMEANDVDACKRGIVSADIGIGTVQGVGKQSMQPLIDAMAGIVRSATSQPQAPPDPGRAGAIINQATAKLYGDNDAKLLPLATFASQSSLRAAPADRLCYTGRRIYETILSFPPAEASLALRYMLSGG